MDKPIWGERTQEDGNQTEYEPQQVKDFIYQYITENEELPSVERILYDLELSDEFYDDIFLELRIYNHEEEVEFRESF